jgi:fermentation-respiration switch protein FrsA (DUF1100 family)
MKRKPLSWLKIGLTVAVVAVVGVYAAILIVLDVRQREFLYFPGRVHVPPARVGLSEFQAVEIKTADGERIVGWWKPPLHPGGGVVLYLHGNGSDLTDRAQRFRDLGNAGFGVLGIDWRGYGGSTGHPTEAGLNADALAAYQWIGRQAPGSRIALFGESLGSGVAITLAARHPVAGIVLDSPYASMLRLAEDHMPYAPVSWMMQDTYTSEARVAQIHAPLFIAHCDRDQVIPLAEGRRLFVAAVQPKEMVVLQGCGHIETWEGETKGKMIERLHRWTDVKNKP